MSNPVATGRKHLTDFVKGTPRFDWEGGYEYFYATVNVEGTGDIDPIGTPLVWNNTDSAFNVYVAQTISSVTGSPLPDGSPICVTVGAKEGLGFNKEDVTLSSTATQMTVMFRGPAAVVESGFEWGTAASPAQTAFRTQYESQGLAITQAAEEVTPSYLS